MSAPHAPSRHDAVAGYLSEVAGGVAGRRVAFSPSASARAAAQALILAASALFGLAVLISQPCRSRGWPSPFQFTHACYSDVPSAIVANSGPASPGARAVIGIADALAPTRGHLVWAVDIVTIMLAVGLAATVVAVVRLAGHRPWDAALFALCPVLVTASLVGVDLVAIGLACAGLAVFASSRSPLASPLVAGALLGLATSIRPVALAAVVTVVLLAIRTGRWAATRWLVLGAVLGLAVPVLVTFATTREELTEYLRTLVDPTLGYGSLSILPRLLVQGIPADQRSVEAPWWTGFVGVAVVGVLLVSRFALPRERRASLLPLDDALVRFLLGLIAFAPLVIVGALPRVLGDETPPGDEVGRVIAWLGWAAVLGAVAWLVMSAPYRPRVASVAALLVVGFFLVAPSFPVQAGLWLAPLLALALPSARVMLAWASVEALYALSTWLYLYGLTEPNRAMPVAWFAVLVIARFVAWGTVAVMIARAAWHPALDPVRARLGVLDTTGFHDDPAAGPFDGLRDRGAKTP